MLTVPARCSGLVQPPGARMILTRPRYDEQPMVGGSAWSTTRRNRADPRWPQQASEAFRRGWIVTVDLTTWAIFGGVRARIFSIGAVVMVREGRPMHKAPCRQAWLGFRYAIGQAVPCPPDPREWRSSRFVALPRRRGERGPTRCPAVAAACA